MNKMNLPFLVICADILLLVAGGCNTVMVTQNRVKSVVQIQSDALLSNNHVISATLT